MKKILLLSLFLIGTIFGQNPCLSEEDNSVIESVEKLICKKNKEIERLNKILHYRDLRIGFVFVNNDDNEFYRVWSPWLSESTTERVFPDWQEPQKRAYGVRIIFETKPSNEKLKDFQVVFQVRAKNKEGKIGKTKFMSEYKKKDNTSSKKDEDEDEDKYKDWSYIDFGNDGAEDICNARLILVKKKEKESHSVVPYQIKFGIQAADRFNVKFDERGYAKYALGSLFYGGSESRSVTDKETNFGGGENDRSKGEGQIGAIRILIKVE